MNKETSIILAEPEGLTQKKRLSKLFAPTMALRGGHSKEVLAASFNTDGTTIASAGADKRIRFTLLFLSIF